MSANYNTSQFEAVVDWIEFEIHPARSTNWQAIKRELFGITGKTIHVSQIDGRHTFNKYAQHPDDEWVKDAPAFRIRIQDVERFADLENMLAGLSSALGCGIPARVTGMEVSFDAYNSSPEQAARFFKFAANLVSDNRRLYRRAEDFPQPLPKRLETLTTRLGDGYMIGVGNKTDDRFQRIYYKRSDCNGGGNQVPVEHRARIEITLQGAALPFTSLEELKRFKFESLAGFFAFRELKPNLTPEELRAANAVTQIGQRKKRRGENGGGVRWFDERTRADDQLNEHARHALQELSRHWRTRHTKRLKNPKEDGEFACGFSRDFFTDSPRADDSQKTCQSPDEQRLGHTPEDHRENGARCGGSNNLPVTDEETERIEQERIIGLMLLDES